MDAYHLGCPVWACKQWQANLYTRRSDRDQWLDQYSQVFNTVEGNSTFYGLPDPKTVERWAHLTHDGFRFALKFPRDLTHERLLIGGDFILDHFLDLLRILCDRDRLGPSLLQLSPRFDGRRLQVLEHFLDKIPTEFPIAVEMRHPDYYDSATHESALNNLLINRKINRVMFDSRPLFSEPPSDEIETESQRRKPRLPYRNVATGPNPMIRLVGRNDLQKLAPWIEEWSQQVMAWVEDGLTPYVFTHAPDDQFAPEMAEMFHEAVRRKIPQLESLPPWPGRSEPQQMELF